MNKWLVFIALLVAYFFGAPVAVEPKYWQAPVNAGFVGDFQSNNKLSQLNYIDIGSSTGPEDVVSDNLGRLYVSTHQGEILRTNADGKFEPWVISLGRPLGMAIYKQHLYVADAYQGLVQVDLHSKLIRLLTDQVNSRPINYANNLDISDEGIIYFSDASTKFGAKQFGGTYEASLLDLLEHGQHGRILQYDLNSGITSVLIAELNFANGVALSHDQSSLYIAETGGYQVYKYHLKGNNKGKLEPFISNLPGFPDNLTRGLDGRYWLGLASPRNELLDLLSQWPILRKMLQRLPEFIRPKAVHYGHVMAFDDQGRITSLQDPLGHYGVNTGAYETINRIYIASLTADKLAYIDKQNVPFD
ncbi:SMP-30/gluconolactonase/LRE family protein [Paraferrimonas sp. SM1919]|uniref:SMP-30/gluconolactonase/LRE family protein n=1 Tax=Paraferrimonas sp. SM1919 TaxID=2662263 RepID=UPI001969DFE2|nr:SMP-30/gluconolactonase/LRE family protein [Paraferrimonas sp. SM1919]